MRFRHFAHTLSLALAVSLSAPALAHGHKHDGDRDMRPDWREGRHPGGYSPDFEAARQDWLEDCRHRVSDNGVGGAVIGGIAGGLIGNRIAGRDNRTVGTVAGAAVGAIAGAAIDKAEDRGRDRDDCEAFLDDYYARGPQGYPGHGYYGYAVPMVMVPVMLPGKPCVETVTTTEYVSRPARRYIPRPRPDKRIRVVPDKRIPLK